MALSTLPGTNNGTVTSGPTKWLMPFIMVTTLFFLWGLAYGLLDVLNKHFQETLNITKTRSTLLQLAYFGAYFLVALPAGMFMNSFGYKKGIVMGLLLYAAGAFMFYPAAQMSSFNLFLLALFILAAGLTCLETAANPYATVLGKPESAAFRLNLSQCFNGMGSFLGPIIAAGLFFTASGKEQNNNLDTVKLVYLIIGFVVLIMAGIFISIRLPEIKESSLVSDAALNKKPLIRHRNLTNAVIAQFFYVAAQVGIAAFFINYCTEAVHTLDNARASYLLSVSLLLFTVGRFTGTALMKKIDPPKLLVVYSIINILLCFIVWKGKGMVTVYALMALFFFCSIMFPTIFALGIKDLGQHTKKGSSFLIMSIVGGAVVPYVMGLLSEKSTADAYIIPLVCFVVIAWFGWDGYKVKK